MRFVPDIANELRVNARAVGQDDRTGVGLSVKQKVIQRIQQRAQSSLADEQGQVGSYRFAGCLLYITRSFVPLDLILPVSEAIPLSGISRTV